MSAPGPPGSPAPSPGGGGININFLPSTAAIRSVLTSQVTPMAIHWFGICYRRIAMAYYLSYYKN